jgi:AraC-like DNA-binding protein
MMRPTAGAVFQKPAEPYEPRGRLDPQGFAQHVRFETRPPPAALMPFVEHGWIIRWDLPKGVYHSPEVMHRPYVDVFVSAEDSGIQGTFRGKRMYRAMGQGRIVGVRFRPGAFHAFWHEELAALEDRIIPLRQVFAWADGERLAKLLTLDDETAVMELMALIAAADPPADSNIELVNAIIAAVESDENLTSVASVAKAFGRSERWLQWLFREYVGLGLKWLLQRHRLLAAAAEIRSTDNPDWAAIAYDLGYSSQQHFITDFRKVLGATPVQYKAGLTQ